MNFVAPTASSKLGLLPENKYLTSLSGVNTRRILQLWIFVLWDLVFFDLLTRTVAY